MSQLLPEEFYNQIKNNKLSYKSEDGNYSCNYIIYPLHSQNLISISNTGKATLKDVEEEFYIVENIINCAKKFSSKFDFIIKYDSRKTTVPSLKVRKAYFKRINALAEKGLIAHTSYIENRKTILAFSKLFIKFINNLSYSIHSNELDADNKIASLSKPKVLSRNTYKFENQGLSISPLRSITLPEWSYSSDNGEYLVNVALLGEKIMYIKAKGVLTLEAIVATSGIYNKVAIHNGHKIDFCIIDISGIKHITRNARLLFEKEGFNLNLTASKTFAILPHFAKTIFESFCKTYPNANRDVHIVNDFETAIRLCQDAGLTKTNQSEIKPEEENLENLKVKYHELKHEFDSYKYNQSIKVNQLIDILGNITLNDSFKPNKIDIDEEDPCYDLFEASWVLQKDIKEIFDLEKEINISLNNIVAKKTDELLKKESNLRSIINNSDKLIMLVDKNFILLEANNLFYQYFKKVIKAEIKIGDNILEIIGENKLKQHLEYWLSYSLTGKNAIYHYPHKVNDITITHEYNVFPVVENGVVEAISIRVDDITSKKLANKKLKSQNEALKQVNSELDHFVYSVSHDLRAPLTSLMGLINLAKQEDNIAVIKDYIALQEKSVSKLDGFIKDIINLARNSRTEVVAEKINLAELFDSIVTDLQFAENSSSVEIVTDIHQNKQVSVDKNRLKIIFSNLISNAQRYADLRKENPKVIIQCRVYENEVVVKVIDNGQGIKKEHQEKIFDMFYRANIYQNGSGLGLYILKESLKKINGKVSLNSEYGIGSTFTVTFPQVINAATNTEKLSTS